MKKAFTLLSIVIFVLLLTVTGSAHPGGTDANGGHNSEDGYHYHHGYPAHDHRDMDGDGFLDCPYAFDDKTGSNSGPSSGGSGQKPTHSNSDDRNNTARYKPVPAFAIVFVLLLCGGYLLWIIARTKDRLSEDSSTEAKICVLVNALLCVTGIIYLLCHCNHPDAWVLRDQLEKPLTFSGIVGYIVIWFFIVGSVGTCIGGVEFLTLGVVHRKKTQESRYADVPGTGVGLFSAYDFAGLLSLVNILLYAFGISDQFFFSIFFA